MSNIFSKISHRNPHAWIHQILLQHPPLQAMQSFSCVSVCISQSALWLRNHRGGVGWAGGCQGMRQEHVPAQWHWEKHTHMRTNTKQQSAVVVTYWGVLNCPRLSVASNPALSAWLIHTGMLRDAHTHAHTHTAITTGRQKGANTHTCWILNPSCSHEDAHTFKLQITSARPCY